MKKTILMSMCIICLISSLLNDSFSKTNAAKMDEQLILEILAKHDSSYKYITELCGPYISGNYALVLTIYGEGGGEAILKKTKNQWEIIGDRRVLSHVDGATRAPTAAPAPAP